MAHINSKPILVSVFLLNYYTPGFATPLYDFNSTPVYIGDSNATVGFIFKTNQSTVINALGFYDNQLDGLTTNHQVGLYDLKGNLLTSTTVPAGTEAVLSGKFRYNSIPGFTLQAGQSYLIAAETNAKDGYPYGNFGSTITGLSINPAITIDKLASRYRYGNGLNFPTANYIYDIYPIVNLNTESIGGAPSGLKPASQLAFGSFAEPNNKPSEATPILPNDKPLFQLFDSAADEDWYEFYAKANLNYSIEIKGGSIGSAINPAIQLYDASGKTLTTLIKQTATTSGIRVAGVAPAKGLYRIRVSNQPPFPRINSAADYGYQIRVFLTDAPQQGIVKGFILNSCNGEGLNEAEVSSYLNNSVTDSTLSYKTGEYSLPLNPDQYTIKSLINDFQEGSTPVVVTQEDIATANVDLRPEKNCPATPTPLDPTLLQQQAVAIYDEQSKLLIVRDVIADNVVYYAELQNIAGNRFKLSRAQSIPGSIHAIPADYSFTTLIANLPSVYAQGRNWKVQLKNLGDFLFSVEKVE